MQCAARCCRYETARIVGDPVCRRVSSRSICDMGLNWSKLRDLRAICTNDSLPLLNARRVELPDPAALVGPALRGWSGGSVCSGRDSIDHAPR